MKTLDRQVVQQSFGHSLRWRSAGAVAVLAALVLLAAGRADAQPPLQRLFIPAPQPSPEIVRELSQPQVTRLGFGTADVDLIGGPAHSDGAPSVMLNLFDDVELVATRDRLERRSPRSYTWFGHLSGEPFSSVILVVRDGLLTGHIFLPGGIYDLVALDDDSRNAIRAIDQSRFPPDEPEEEIPGPSIVSAARRSPALPLGDGTLAQATACAPNDFIDVLVAYTDDVGDASGDILGEIQAAIDDTNESYVNSGITQRLRLVHTEEVAYAENNNLTTTRDELQDPSDNSLDGLHTSRDTHGADIVSLWIETSDKCGKAFIMDPVAVTFEDHAFAVVVHECAVGNHSFAHELGHVMSARHDWDEDNTNNGPFSYNHGYVDDDDCWRTIMAYDNCPSTCDFCDRMQFWSNPDLTFGGDPTGVAEGMTNAADNRKTLNNTRATVQQFRAATAPSASAGPDTSVECGQPTMLDGSASCDPDGGTLTYAWTDDFLEGGGTATGVKPTVTFPQGIHTVTLVVSDGLVSSVPDTVEIDALDDLTPPTVTCPAAIVVECTEDGGTTATHSAIAAFLAAASASDACDASPSLGHDAPGFFPIGVTPVTFSSTDAAGLTGTCTATVRVVDTIPPVVPPDITIECTSPLGSTLQIGVPTDVCDDQLTFSNDAPSTLPFGATTVTWMATDASNNSLMPPNDTQVVTVVDTVPPVLTISVAPDVLWPPDHTLRTVHVTITATDVCDAAPAVRLVSVTSSEADRDPANPRDRAHDIQGATIGTDDRSFRLRAEHSAGGARAYTITYVARDSHGNETLPVQATVRVPKSGVTLISRDRRPGNGHSAGVAINVDGAVVAFASAATNLVRNDSNDQRDVFVRVRTAPLRTERVSIADDETQADGPSERPSVNGDGSLVAFASTATNLVPGDDNQRRDVFLRDRDAEGTERISLSTANAEAHGSSTAPSIDREGRFVAFQSTAEDLVVGDTNGASDIFVRDRATQTTERLCGTTQGDRFSVTPAISADGRFVAFASAASNLVPADSNRRLDIFVCDRTTGMIDRVSVATGGAQGNRDSLLPAISADGRFVAFKSLASNLVPNDRNGVIDVFVRDRLTGTTERVSSDRFGGDANDASFPPTISDDGRFVAFGSFASDLVSYDTNDIASMFVRDRAIGFTYLVDVNDDGQLADGGALDLAPAMTGDGVEIGFASTAENLAGERNQVTDVFVVCNPALPTAPAPLTLLQRSAGAYGLKKGPRPPITAVTAARR